MAPMLSYWFCCCDCCFCLMLLSMSLRLPLSCVLRLASLWVAAAAGAVANDALVAATADCIEP